MAIHFENLTSFNLPNKILLKKWLTTSAKKENKKISLINFVICTDEYLLALNIKHLNHNTLTDIITFDYCEDQPENTLAGDIFISAERIEENAKKFKTGFDEEMKRVMIHGVLHLCGYKDKTPKHKAEMTAKEDLYLKEFSL